MEQAAAKVPGLGKQWRRSGKIHSRENHDLIDGQVRDVNQPFELHTKKDGTPLLMMHPHDPTAPVGEVINCGCISIPHMKNWKMLNPGKLPFSQLELQHSQKKRELNDAIHTNVKLTEANFNLAQMRDAGGKWVNGGGINATLTGNELGVHGSTKELRKAAMAHAEQWIGNTFKNANSGHTIMVTRQGLKHALSGANEMEVKLAAGLPQILTKSAYQGAHPPKPGTEHYIKSAHKYLAKVKIGDEVLNVGIVTHEKWSGHEHYDHYIVSKK